MRGFAELRFSSPVPVQREAMILYMRECIKLAHDLGRADLQDLRRVARHHAL